MSKVFGEATGKMRRTGGGEEETEVLDTGGCRRDVDDESDEAEDEVDHNEAESGLELVGTASRGQSRDEYAT